MGAGVSTTQLTPEDEEFMKQVREGFGELDENDRIRIADKLEPLLRKSVIEHCPTVVQVTVINAFHVKPSDLLGNSDPYVKVLLNGEERNTKAVSNTSTPTWNEDFLFENVVIKDTALSLSLWDKDTFQDDSLGNVVIRVAGEGHYTEQRVMSGNGGTLQFSYFVTPHELPDLSESVGNLDKTTEIVETICSMVSKHNSDAAVSLRTTILAQLREMWNSNHAGDNKNKEPGPVVRKDIRNLTEEEQQRFVAALQRMMQNKDGPETSEFFRLAGYHGWPNDYCVHRTECFPVWHRAYLVAFERQLRNADKELGNDGRIALPYWDFGKEVNGQTCPDIMRNFPELPKDFFKESTKHKLVSRGYKVNSENQVKQLLEKSNAKGLLALCLEESNHWRHASNETKHGTSLENPHNAAHMALGFPLTSLKYAAFHPLFYLLHCNVDRYYEGYLRQEPDSLQEFRDHQAMLDEQGKQNKFHEPLVPFEDHRRSTTNAGKETAPTFCPGDLLCDLRHLDYEYDQLPKRQPAQMRVPPLWMLFEDVDIVNCMLDKDGEMKSFLLHVFLYNKSAYDGNTVPEIPAQLEAIGNSSDVPGKLMYAGWVAALAGKGPGCSNCKVNNTVNLTHDITKVAKQLGARRSQLGYKILCVDEVGDIVKFEELQHVYGENLQLPEPSIVGPFFELPQDPLSKIQNNSDVDEVRSLQTLLTKWGFYDGPLDGIFTDQLEESLRRYQRFVGVLDDGIAGPITKSMMIAARNDPDADEVSGLDMPTYAKGSTVKWWLGTSPGYLDQEQVMREVQTAMVQWASKLESVLHFENVQIRDESNLVIIWGDNTGLNDFKFDGKGGAIAHATPGTIQFDCSERWELVCKTDHATREGQFLLLPVLLHEIGHALGVRGHSNDPIAVLGPYYVSNRIVVTSTDVNRVLALYEQKSADKKSDDQKDTIADDQSKQIIEGKT